MEPPLALVAAYRNRLLTSDTTETGALPAVTVPRSKRAPPPPTAQAWIVPPTGSAAYNALLSPRMHTAPGFEAVPGMPVVVRAPVSGSIVKPHTWFIVGPVTNIIVPFELMAIPPG